MEGASRWSTLFGGASAARAEVEAPAPSRLAWLQRPTRLAVAGDSTAVHNDPAIDLDVQRGVDSWIAGVQSKVDDDVERMMEAELRGGLNPYSGGAGASDHVLRALANEQGRSMGAALFSDVAHGDTAPIFGGTGSSAVGGVDVDASTLLSRAIDRELSRISEDERGAAGDGAAGTGSGGGGQWDNAGAFLEMLQRTNIDDAPHTARSPAARSPAARSPTARSPGGAGRLGSRDGGRSVAGVAAAAKERDAAEREDDVAAREMAQRLVQRWATMEDEAEAIHERVRLEVGVGERRRADARRADSASSGADPNYQLRRGEGRGGSGGGARARSTGRQRAADSFSSKVGSSASSAAVAPLLPPRRDAVLSERIERALQSHLARRSVAAERRAALKEAEDASVARRLRTSVASRLVFRAVASLRPSMRLGRAGAALSLSLLWSGEARSRSAS